MNCFKDIFKIKNIDFSNLESVLNKHLKFLKSIFLLHTIYLVEHVSL